MNESDFAHYRRLLSKLLQKKQRARTKRRGRVITHKRRECLEEQFVPIPAGSPTKARPGTYKKLEVMRARWSLGQELHHPRDAWW